MYVYFSILFVSVFVYVVHFITDIIYVDLTHRMQSFSMSSCYHTKVYKSELNWIFLISRMFDSQDILLDRVFAHLHSQIVICSSPTSLMRQTGAKKDMAVDHLYSYCICSNWFRNNSTHLKWNLLRWNLITSVENRI